MKDYVQFILGMKRKVSEKTLEQLKEMGVTEDEVTGQTLALMKIMDKAIAGDIKAQKTGKTVELCCAIGDETVGGVPYAEIVEAAREYIKRCGGFEKFAEWGLY